MALYLQFLVNIVDLILDMSARGSRIGLINVVYVTHGFLSSVTGEYR